METGGSLRQLRRERGWSQTQAARRLRVSQTYWSLLESGARDLPSALAERLVRLGLPARHLPLPADLRELGTPDDAALVVQLACLGYSGFAHYRTTATRPMNPGAVLLWALSSPRLDPRVLEALPWLMLHHWPLDQDWLLAQAKLHDLQNRLGFMVNLARQLGTRDGARPEVTQGLAALEAALEPSRLAREDTLCDAGMGQSLREHLRRDRIPAAVHWNVLTDWKVEHLKHVEERAE